MQGKRNERDNQQDKKKKSKTKLDMRQLRGVRVLEGEARSRERAGEEEEGRVGKEAEKKEKRKEREQGGGERWGGEGKEGCRKRKIESTI